jgi:hypothetical protein
VKVNGHLLSLQLQPANLPDEIGAWPVIRPVKGLKKVLADQGYDNDLLKDLCLAVGLATFDWRGKDRQILVICYLKPHEETSI